MVYRKGLCYLLNLYLRLSTSYRVEQQQEEEEEEEEQRPLCLPPPQPIGGFSSCCLCRETLLIVSMYVLHTHTHT